jgi:hypothetical protein
LLAHQALDVGEAAVEDDRRDLSAQPRAAA